MVWLFWPCRRCCRADAGAGAGAGCGSAFCFAGAVAALKLLQMNRCRVDAGTATGAGPGSAFWFCRRSCRRCKCWLWIGILVLPALLPYDAGAGSAFCLASAGAVLALVQAFAATLALALGRRFVLRAVVCWCCCRHWRWNGVSFCITPGMTSGHARDDVMSCQERHRVMPGMTCGHIARDTVLRSNDHHAAQAAWAGPCRSVRAGRAHSVAHIGGLV